MDFYKLTDFQLYSIINSRHLDKKSKGQAENELERRNLSQSEVDKLKEELVEKTKATPPVFNMNSNVMLLLAVLVLLFLLLRFLYK